jgi:hypothetical protein
MILFAELLKGGVAWTDNQDSKFTFDVSGKKDLSDINLHSVLQTPYEKLKNAELSLKNKVSTKPYVSSITDLGLNLLILRFM